MSDGRGDERSFFGSIAKNQTKYGSTTNPTQKYTKYVMHTVSRVDTLMGLALKYGATVEQIKRENKLWTNDSLFLREHLYIPITRDNSHLVQDDWELLSSDEVRARTNSDTFSNSGSSDTDSRQSSEAAGANGDSSVRDARVQNGGPLGSDFFSKYDSSFADLKTKVDKLEKSSRNTMSRSSFVWAKPLGVAPSMMWPVKVVKLPLVYCNCDNACYGNDDLSSLIPRRHSDISRTTRKSRSVSLENPDSPVLVIKSNTMVNKVQSAVRRSEVAQDNLFEL